MNSVNLGEQLSQLRAMMAAKSLVPNDWPRTQLAREAGVSLAALTRLEETGHGDAEVLAAVLRFYQNRGVNLAWVLAPDNADMPLPGFRDTSQDEEQPRARQRLADLRRLLQPLVAELDAGPTLAPEALRALLTQIQEGIHHVLKHQLPLRPVKRTEADLRAWHKFFPPVPAQSTGWHPVALFTVPYHYCEAGDFLPRCGEDVPVLFFNPVLENVPDSDKCGVCRSRMDETSPAFAQPKIDNVQ